MNLNKYMKITEELLTNEEVEFFYDNHFIVIQESVEGGYDGSVYLSKEDFEQDNDCVDGGYCETIVAAIEFFIDISRDINLCK